MRFRELPSKWLLCGLLLTNSGTAFSSMIAWDISGTVWAVNNFDGSFTTSVPIGTQISFRYVFDSLSVDSQGDPRVGVYRQRLTDGASIEGGVGPLRFVSTADYKITLTDRDDINTDHYSVTASNGISADSSSQTFENVGFFLNLLDQDAEAFSSDALPIQPLDLQDFAFATPVNVNGVIMNYLGEIDLEKDGPSGRAQWAIRASVDSIKQASIPESSTLSLLGLGLAAIGYQRRKRAS